MERRRMERRVVCHVAPAHDATLILQLVAVLLQSSQRASEDGETLHRTPQHLVAHAGVGATRRERVQGTQHLLLRRRDECPGGSDRDATLGVQLAAMTLQCSPRARVGSEALHRVHQRRGAQAAGGLEGREGAESAQQVLLRRDDGRIALRWHPPQLLSVTRRRQGSVGGVQR